MSWKLKNILYLFFQNKVITTIQKVIMINNVK